MFEPPCSLLTVRGKYAPLTIPDDCRAFLTCSAQSSGYLVKRTHITFVGSLFCFLSQLISESFLSRIVLFLFIASCSFLIRFRILSDFESRSIVLILDLSSTVSSVIHSFLFILQGSLSSFSELILDSIPSSFYITGWTSKSWSSETRSKKIAIFLLYIIVLETISCGMHFFSFGLTDPIKSEWSVYRWVPENADI